MTTPLESLNEAMRDLHAVGAIDDVTMLAATIRQFFLDGGGGKWEADKDGCLWIYDANYGFDPIALAKKLQPR